MVPTTRNLLHHDGKSRRGRSCYHPGQYYVSIAAQLEASAASARQQDDQSRKPSRSPRLRTMADDDKPAAAAGPGTSSTPGGAAGAANDEGDWLQLGLSAASASSSSSSASSSGDNNSTDPAPGPALPPAPMELDLFAYDDKRSARMRPPLFPLPLRSYHQSYGGRGRPYRPVAASGSMSAPFLPFMPPFRCSGDAIRVISPPRRTETPGLWLTLQAAPNQIREPILPQIAKSYLRIKDSNMKVEVVMKYLAEKLGIAPSHQVELTCRGQVLPPLLLVKYVRETIWCSTSTALREEEQETPPDLTSSAATDHVMTLCYSTCRNSNSNCN